MEKPGPWAGGRGQGATTGISALLPAPRVPELPLGHSLSSLPQPPSSHYFPPDMGTSVRKCACMWLDEQPFPHRRVSSLGDSYLDVGCSDLVLPAQDPRLHVPPAPAQPTHHASVSPVGTWSSSRTEMESRFA